MAFIVVPGTGSQAGMYLVCQTGEGVNGVEPVVIVASFDDELDALDHRDALNGEHVGIEETKAPDEMLQLLDMLT